MPETRTLTPEQKDKIKRKLLVSKGFRTAEIQGIASAFDVPIQEVRKALREIRKNLTEEEAGGLNSNGG